MARTNKAGVTGISAMLSRLEKLTRESIEEDFPELTTAEVNEQIVERMRVMADKLYSLLTA